MVESLLDRYPLRGVECEQLPDQVEEVPVDGVRGGYYFL